MQKVGCHKESARAKRRIVLFSNTDWFMYQFNLGMAQELEKCGYSVMMLSPKGQYSRQLSESNVRYISVPFSRTSLNPWSQIKFIIWMWRFLVNEKIDVVHNFTIKNVVIGSVAARLAGVKIIVNELTGMGYMYTSRAFKARLIKFLIELCLKIIVRLKGVRMVLLNNSDYFLFKNKIAKRGGVIYLVLGVGIDCKKFSFDPVPHDGALRVVLPARMLKDKGVVEFVEASRIIKGKGLEIEFILAGGCDPANPTSVPEVEIKKWQDQGLVKWLGHNDNIVEVYRSVDIVVLPSYREGLPTSLTEAAACGLPLISTSVAGCEDVVQNGVNGLLVPPQDPASLVTAIEYLAKNPDVRKSFGFASRRVAIEKFSKEVIYGQRVKMYN
jgi:glycosyltransferase involved in cell wall biosynthesis